MQAAKDVVKSSYNQTHVLHDTYEIDIAHKIRFNEKRTQFIQAVFSFKTIEIFEFRNTIAAIDIVGMEHKHKIQNTIIACQFK